MSITADGSWPIRRSPPLRDGSRARRGRRSARRCPERHPDRRGASGGTLRGLQSQVQAFNQKYPDVTVNIQTFGYNDLAHQSLLHPPSSPAPGRPICARIPRSCAYAVRRRARRLERVSRRVRGLLRAADPRPRLLPGQALRTGDRFRADRTALPEGHLGRNTASRKRTSRPGPTWPKRATRSTRTAAVTSRCTGCWRTSSLYEVLAVEQGFAGYYFDDTDTKVIVDDPKAIAAVEVIKQLWDGKGALHDSGGGYLRGRSRSSRVARWPPKWSGPAWYPFYLTQQIPEQSGKWRLMRAPAIEPGGPRVGYQFPTIFVMPSQSQQQDLAWEFEVMGLTGDGARADFDVSHIMPADAALLEELNPSPTSTSAGRRSSSC